MTKGMRPTPFGIREEHLEELRDILMWYRERGVRLTLQSMASVAVNDFIARERVRAGLKRFPRRKVRAIPTGRPNQDAERTDAFKGDRPIEEIGRTE